MGAQSFFVGDEAQTDLVMIKRTQIISKGRMRNIHQM